MDDNNVILPKELTAENGAKCLLSGEFKEQIELYDHESYQYYTHNVTVSWTTIKKIYRMIVDNMEVKN